MFIGHLKMSAKDFIDHINKIFLSEDKRSRILLAEVLLRLERMEQKLDKLEKGETMVEEKDQGVIWETVFNVPVTVQYISDDRVVFSNGLELKDMHDQDCCEHVYADWEALKTTGFVDETFKKLVIKGIKDGGIGLNEYFVPCYNDQNGYYSSQLHLDIGGKLVDISDYVKDEIC